MLGLGVLLVIVLGDETYYDSETAKRQTAEVESGKNKSLIHFEKLVGITGYKAHYKGVGETVTALGVMVSRPHFLALCGMYITITSITTFSAHMIAFGADPW